MKATIEIKNLKLLKDVQGEFESGNFYLVRAGNAKGKSTFIQALKSVFTAMSTTTTPVTFGEQEGQVTASIENFKGEKGNNIKVIFDFTNEKESFKLITADTSIIRNKTDIREYFKYNSFTVDEFFAWGKTAEGRRKQAKVLFELIPATIRNEISGIDTLINEKNGTIFSKRKQANAECDSLKGALDRGVLSDEEKKSIEMEKAIRDKIEAYEDEIRELNTKINANSDILSKVRPIDGLILSVKNSDLKQSSKDKIIEILKEEIAELNKGLTDIDKASTKKAEINESISKGRLKLESVIKLKTQKETYEKNLLLVQDTKKEAERLTGELEKYRLRKKDLYSEAKVNSELEIVGDELWYRTEGGELIPFDTDSLSYSRAGLIVAEFILKLNKTLPIILLGNAAEYDKDAKDKLAALAKANDCIIFGDQVTFDAQQKLTIDLYES